jgi:hypothetical protein
MTIEKLHALATKLDAIGADYLAQVVRKLIKEKIDVEELEAKLIHMGFRELTKE